MHNFLRDGHQASRTTRAGRVQRWLSTLAARAVRRLLTAAVRAREVSSAQQADSRTNPYLAAKALHQLHPAAGASSAAKAQAIQRHQAVRACSGGTSPQLQVNPSLAATTLRLHLRAEDCLVEAAPAETQAVDQAAVSASDNRIRALRPSARHLRPQSRLHQACLGTSRHNSKAQAACQHWEEEEGVETRAGAASSAT